MRKKFPKKEGNPPRRIPFKHLKIDDLAKSRQLNRIKKSNTCCGLPGSVVKL